MRRFCTVVVGIIAASAVVLVGGPASASSSDSTTISVAGEQLTMSREMAAQVNDPNGWGNLTVAQLAAVGIHPGMGKFPPKANSKQQVVPASASGCDYNSLNNSMCIYIYGYSLQVTEWDTSVTISSYRCSYAGYWVNSSLVATSNTVCGQNGALWGYWAPNKRMGPGQACNTFVGIAGRPCETLSF